MKECKLESLQYGDSTPSKAKRSGSEERLIMQKLGGMGIWSGMFVIYEGRPGEDIQELGLEWSLDMPLAA